MDNTEVKYKNLKGKLKFKGELNVEYTILALKAEIEEPKDVATVTKTKCVVPRKGNGRRSEIPNWMKTPPNN